MSTKTEGGDFFIFPRWCWWSHLPVVYIGNSSAPITDLSGFNPWKLTWQDFLSSSQAIFVLQAWCRRKRIQRFTDKKMPTYHAHLPCPNLLVDSQNVYQDMVLVKPQPNIWIGRNLCYHYPKISLNTRDRGRKIGDCFCLSFTCQR